MEEYLRRPARERSRGVRIRFRLRRTPRSRIGSRLQSVSVRCDGGARLRLALSHPGSRRQRMMRPMKMRPPMPALARQDDRRTRLPLDGALPRRRRLFTPGIIAERMRDEAPPAERPPRRPSPRSTAASAGLPKTAPRIPSSKSHAYCGRRASRLLPFSRISPPHRPNPPPRKRQPSHWVGSGRRLKRTLNYSDWT